MNILFGAKTDFQSQKTTRRAYPSYYFPGKWSKTKTLHVQTHVYNYLGFVCFRFFCFARMCSWVQSKIEKSSKKRWNNTCGLPPLTFFTEMVLKQIPPGHSLPLLLSWICMRWISSNRSYVVVSDCRVKFSDKFHYGTHFRAVYYDQGTCNYPEPKLLMTDLSITNNIFQDHWKISSQQEVTVSHSNHFSALIVGGCRNLSRSESYSDDSI